MFKNTFSNPFHIFPSCSKLWLFPIYPLKWQLFIIYKITIIRHPNLRAWNDGSPQLLLGKLGWWNFLRGWEGDLRKLVLASSVHLTVIFMFRRLRLWLKFWNLSERLDELSPSGVSSNFWGCSGSKSLETASGSRELEQQVISVSLRMTLVRAAHSAMCESYNQNFNTTKIDVWIVQSAQIS